MLVVSALLYGCSFVMIYCFWWLSLLFLIPLAWDNTVFKKNPFRSGMVWGALTYGLQSLALFDFVYHHQTNLFFLIFLCFVLFLLIVLSGLWFVAMSYIQIKNGAVRLELHALCAWLFFMIVHHGLFYWCTGQWFGYPFSNPLIPLIHHSSLVHLSVVYVGISCSLFVLIAVQLIIAAIGNAYRVVFFLLLIGLEKVADRYQHTVVNNYNIVSVPVAVQKENSFYERIELLAQALFAAQNTYQNARVFLFPEGVFPYSDYASHEKLIQVLTPCCSAGSLILVGVYRVKDDYRYNSCLCAQEGRIILYYDKKILIPFFEYIPFNDLDFLNVENKQSFKEGFYDQQGSIQYGQGNSAIIKICAECFWQDSQHKNGTIFALVNDDNFNWAYFPECMYWWAYLRASELNQTLLYAGYLKKREN